MIKIKFVKNVKKIVQYAGMKLIARLVMKEKIIMKEMENVDIVMRQKTNLLLKENVNYVSQKDAQIVRELIHAQYVMLQKTTFSRMVLVKDALQKVAKIVLT